MRVSTRSISRTLQYGLALAWLVVALAAVRASARPTYREFSLGVAPVIEWPRVVVVWGILAAELLAFFWWVRVLASTSSRAERVWSIAGGVGVSLALSLTIRSHAPEELNRPGRIALLVVVAGVAIALAAGARAAIRRFRAGTG